MSTPHPENELASKPPPPTAAGQRPSGSRPQPRSGFFQVSSAPGWGWILFALAAVHLAQPLLWGPPRLPVWSPAVGLGFVLVAWFGWRFGSGVLATSGLLVVGQYLARAAFVGDVSRIDLRWIFVETTLLPLEAVAAWELYHSLGRGTQRLGDPRSAMSFVLLVPGAIAILWGLLHLGFASVIETPALGPGGFLRHWTSFWLAHALGLLVAAPPLLVLLTPWLHRRGWLRPETSVGGRSPIDLNTGRLVPFADSSAFEPEGNTGSALGDWLEIGLFGLATSVACVLLSRLHGPGELLGWQLWGGPGLLIVWAGLRQGLRGGTVVASVAAVVLLLARHLGLLPSSDSLFQPLLQGHLVAQSSAALLISAGAAWLRRRDADYRQVVSQVAVVIYSARLLRMPCGSDPPRGTEPVVSPGSDPPRPRTAPRREIGQGVAEITLVNNASVKLLGVHGVHLLGDYTRWMACIYSEDREVIVAALEQLARQDQPVACEYRLASSVAASSKREAPAESLAGEIVLPRPATRWLRDTLAPRRDRDGRLLGWEGVVTDITEQRALADDLRRTTNMFHALIGNLPTGVFFVHGERGLPILVNARARQLLGQREDPAAGFEHMSEVYRLFRADGTPFPVEELPVYLALVEGRTTMRDDIVVYRSDGRRVPLVTWAAPVDLGGRGSPRAAVWVIEDLTALHLAEAARKDSEGRLRVIIETMAEGMLIHDDQGRIVSSNPAAAAFFGMPAERMSGQTLADFSWVFFHEKGGLLAPDEHPTRIALRTARPVRHVILGVQSPGMSDSGSGSCLLSRWILVNAMPLGSASERTDRRSETSQAGVPAGVVTTFTDISAYVHAREAIRTSEERYRGLVESLPLMLVQCDRSFRVTYINPATSALTGYSREDVAEPATWGSMVVAEDLPTVYRVFQSSLAGQTDRCEFRYRAKDGSEQVAYCISQPRYQDGVVVGITNLLVDVTHERRLERELQRAQRLELIGRLSSGVAHDFNNLLGVVLNLTDLARGHLPPDHPVNADLLRIGEATEQAAGLASQLLALSKQRPTAVRRIDVNHVSRRTLALLEATLPAMIDLQSDLAAGELPILAAETQVQQVLMNLCLNARDAMPGGGDLRVRTFAEGGQVHLVVADTGTGMSDELRGQVFEPFFSTKERGTGLGLAVVQQIVESHGGKVVLTSKSGEGASFEVTWPAIE